MNKAVIIKISDLFGQSLNLVSEVKNTLGILPVHTGT